LVGILWHNCRSTVKRAVLRACSVVRRLDRRAGKSVLLTFDDGPHPEITPAVLDRLQSYDARAVFFVVGYLIRRAGPRGRELLNRALAEGHLLGNHTYRHDPYRKVSLRSYVRDLRDCQQLVADLTGERPKLFRPPLGSLTVQTLFAPKVLGLKTVYWSVECDDWQLQNAADARAYGERLADTVCAGDIVTLHDNNPHVVTVLDALLPKLAARGWDLGRAARGL
jgi:peptidoglycan/xylan/chitin deacetylase (PgdA/CDA1 family)